MNGEVVSIEAFNLAIRLESQGVMCEERDGMLWCGPLKHIGIPEHLKIHRLQDELLTITRYVGETAKEWL